jgi:hypothetical protein
MWILGPDQVNSTRCDDGELFGCDPPPADHGDPRWLRQAGHSGELPPERSWKSPGCDGTWLVMDIAGMVTGCQPMDGMRRPSSCLDAMIRVRWFFKFVGNAGWEMVGQGGGAGCADIHAAVPEFPSALCVSLPAR